MGVQDWKAGDWVIHASRPEWGSGQILSAEGTIHEGKRCQRVSVRFDRAGLKTLSTAFAELRTSVPSGRSGFSEPKPEELADGASMPTDLALIAQNLANLPENATDPFVTLRKRTETTLSLYRFTGTGSSLLEWATMQTGLRDPLSSFSRHELEAQFQRFRTNMDAHLKKLIWDLKKKEPGAIAEIEAAAAPQGKQMLHRFNALR